MTPWLGITWGISNRYGWGVYGLNLVRELLRKGGTFPVCFGEIAANTLNAETCELLAPVIKFQKDNLSSFMRETKVARLRDAVVVHALGNDAEWSLISNSIEGDKNVGVIFFEHSNISEAGLNRLSKLDQVVAGSTWNAEVLIAAGAQNVVTVFQGIDTSLFRPMPSSGAYDGKFVVFSGGKLDYRKGQDIELSAFRAFAQNKDDVILAAAWHNLWPLTAAQFRHSPHLKTMPYVDAQQRLNITRLATDNGIPGSKFVDLGLIPNEEMPDVLKEMDLAVFPNRCEGGTNLVAMETMACGVPCILAKNTGHLDIMNDGNCWVLEQQEPVSFEDMATDGWGESSVDELVALMERAYENRPQCRAIGQAGAQFMRSWSWQSQIELLLSNVEKILK